MSLIPEDSLATKIMGLVLELALVDFLIDMDAMLVNSDVVGDEALVVFRVGI